jgi:hypothetical protein
MNDIRSGICPHCGHNEIIRAKKLHVIPSRYTLSEPVGIARLSPYYDDLTGELSLFICRRSDCGFAQWFVSEPEKIPISEAHSTELIRGTKIAGPYR